MSIMAWTRGTPARRPPGAATGAVLGVVAGWLVVTIWRSSPDVGVAVAVVFAGLVVCLLWSAQGWHRFGVAFLVGAVVAAAAYGVLLYDPSLGP